MRCLQMVKKTAFTKMYRRGGNQFKTAKEGMNRRIRYFYCKSCDMCHLRRMGEVKPKVCERGGCESKKFQYLASQVEAKRYAMLKLLENQGDLTELNCQKEYALEVNGIHIRNYRADFEYINHKGIKVTEDAKPKIYRDEVYLMKKMLMLACHGIEIQEVN